jgi:2'-5' RNA ligase
MEQSTDQASATMFIGYGVLVPPSVFNRMRDLQLDVLARYGENHGLHQPPHITVKAPFEIGDLEKHKRYLDVLGAETPPLSVTLSGVSFFDGGVMFLDVEANAGLKDLGQRILNDLGSEATPSPFEATGQVHHHATLAFMDPTKLPDAKRDFGRMRDVVTFEADQLGLFLGLGGRNSPEWIVIRVAALRGARDGSGMPL